MTKTKRNTYYKQSYSEPIPTKGICVDGSCTGQNPNGILSFQIVDIATKKVLENHECGIGTNNHSEYIGLCYAILTYPNETIYCDSLTAISWARKKRHNSLYPHPDLDMCDFTLQNLNYVPDVRKWKTKEWGENLADFGYK